MQVAAPGASRPTRSCLILPEGRLATSILPCGYGILHTMQSSHSAQSPCFVRHWSLICQPCAGQVQIAAWLQPSAMQGMDWLSALGCAARRASEQLYLESRATAAVP